MKSTFSYIPGGPQPYSSPLSRFLPPLNPGIAAGWLRENIPRGEILLDPFGSTPFLPLEAAQAGYRVVVTCNNPLLVYLLRMLAKAPVREEFQSALYEILATERGAERLDRHLMSLYQTDCDNCNRIVQVEAFLWKRGEDQPYAKIINCPDCGSEGEKPVSNFDRETLGKIRTGPIHRARAVERVTGRVMDQAPVMEHLSTYLPRPLYFIFTLLNRVEGMSLLKEESKRDRELLTALLISLFDQGNALWPWPAGRLRPKQLATPPHFREKNLWVELEQRIAGWTDRLSIVPVTDYPELPPPEGGICVFNGRLREFTAQAMAPKPAGVLMVIPRPNQAFWALSAIWSGWLWGSQAVEPLRSALTRKRYDWYWHTMALNSVFEALRHVDKGDLPVFCIMPELVSGFLTATVLAFAGAGFNASGMAVSDEEKIGQLVVRQLKQGEVLNAPKDANRSYKKAIDDYLYERSEPSPQINIHAACLAAVSQTSKLQHSDQLRELYGELHNGISAMITDTRHLRRMLVKQAGRETNLWWFSESSPVAKESLTDKVELLVLELLNQETYLEIGKLLQRVYGRFSGLCTPERLYIEACLESYGELSYSTPQRWSLKPNEVEGTRHEDLLEIESLIRAIGERLGFVLRDAGGSILWEDHTGKIQGTRFILTTTCAVSRRILTVPGDGKKNILVLPGGRSALLAHKLFYDPRLKEAIMRNWETVKFRHLRHLISREDLTYELWCRLIRHDPVVLDEATQLSIFEN